MDRVDRMQEVLSQLSTSYQHLNAYVVKLEARVEAIENGTLAMAFDTQDEAVSMEEMRERTVTEFTNLVNQIVEGFDLPVRKVLDMFAKSSDYSLEGAPHPITENEFFSQTGDEDWVAENYYRLTFAVDVAMYYASLMSVEDDRE